MPQGGNPAKSKIITDIYTMNPANTSPITILFDLDGTLVHSAPDLQDALNRLLVREGRGELELVPVQMMIGDGVRKLVERGLKATGDVPDEAALDRLTEDFIADYEPNSAVKTRPFPGAVEAVKTLKEAGHSMAVCTNKPAAAAITILERLELAPYFPVLIGGDSLQGIRKPDPRFLVAAMDQLGGDPARAVMVGDNANDVEASRGAGIKVVLATFGYTKTPAAELGADGLFDHFDGLPGLLETLF